MKLGNDGGCNVACDRVYNNLIHSARTCLTPRLVRAMGSHPFVDPGGIAF